MRRLRSRLAPTLSILLVIALMIALVSGCASLTKSWIAPEVALTGGAPGVQGFSLGAP